MESMVWLMVRAALVPSSLSERGSSRPWGMTSSFKVTDFTLEIGEGLA